MTEPYKHQTDIVNRFKDAEYGAIFAEPGTGKTFCAIRICEHKWITRQTSAVLVVTTKGLMLNWADVELPKHASVWYKAGVWGRNSIQSPQKSLFYFVINIDALRTEAFIPMIRKFLQWYPDFTLIVDESTFAKSAKAKRTKMLLRVARKAKARFIMTGTPVVNSPMDLWSQCDILEPNVMGYKNFYAFRSDFTVMKTMQAGFRSFQKVVGYKNLDELTKILNTFSVMVRARDCLDLPARRYRRVHHEFTDEQRKAYEDLRKTAITYIQNHTITAVNAVSLINRLMQICAGQLKLPDGTYLSIPNNRLPLLRDLVDEANKVIVWTSFVNTAREISEMLGKESVHLSSGLSPTGRQEVVNQFRNTDTKVLIANPASAGHGLTLVEADTVIYYSNSFNYEHRVQSEYRTDRIGQTKSVLYTDLLLSKTVEEKVLDVLTAKKEIADEVLKGLESPGQFILSMLEE